MSTNGSHSLQDLADAQPGSQLGNGGRQVLKEVAEYSRKVVRLLSGEIKSQSRSIASEQFKLASSNLDTLAEALREAAGKLREKHSYSLAEISETGSENIMNVANFLRDGDPDRIVGKV
ncbi:hypothetical protein SBDP1_130041 [Syntrophobacter sp. SbD1]|nr:hypothetical protein SBDP1_130041 [Syntrophobacter sp. SbD1]